ncbi:hypothetical protein AJ79_00690 [Helicocarpus griseus UAMH5409]|uniref:Rhodopsin domain-containing protein n=1 Tax=Helicocarpus griseus UAMH5409 TaxID=1447875 RepID=A0A2B7YAK1_9EURO|nr:hypothetical protein AJ79_00690 [Helicocarpus griseus UAMH5409]
MRNPPPEVMATWPKPNYVNPEYQGPAMPIIGIVFLAISVIVVTLRLFVRIHMKRSAGYDDWLMLATMPFIVAVTVSTILGTHYGWGVHIWDNKPEWSSPSRLTSWLSQLFFIIIMTLVKLSILSSYIRISSTQSKRRNNFNRLSWLMCFFVLAWGIAFLIAVCTACSPLDHYWVALTEETCQNESARLMGATISNIITDLIVLVLPIPTFWSLRLPIRERLVLIAMMSLGLIACAASIVRCYYTYVTTDLTYDVSWYGYTLWLWFALETNLAVICASIPTLRPFAKKYFPKLGFKQSTFPSQYGTQLGSQQPGIFKEHTIQQVIEHNSSTEELNSERHEYPMSPIRSHY